LIVNNTSSFLTWSVQLISILLQHQIILDYNSATAQLLDNHDNHPLNFTLFYLFYCLLCQITTL
jgi:hypothetical protein